MKILYVWINNYKNIQKTGFNFTSKFMFSYLPKENILKAELNNNNLGINNFFYINDVENKNLGRVEDIIALVGENGAGKSSFISFIFDYLTILNDKDSFIIYEPEIKDEKTIFKVTKKVLIDNKLNKIIIKVSDIPRNSSNIININPLFQPFNMNHMSLPYAGFKNLTENYLISNDINSFSNSSYPFDETNYKDHINQHKQMELVRETRLLLNDKNKVLDDLFLFKVPKNLIIFPNENSENDFYNFIFDIINGDFKRKKFRKSLIDRFEEIVAEKDLFFLLRDQLDELEKRFLKDRLETFLIKVYRTSFFSFIKEFVLNKSDILHSDSIKDVIYHLKQITKKNELNKEDLLEFLEEIKFKIAAYGDDIQNRIIILQQVNNLSKNNFISRSDYRFSFLFVPLNKIEGFIEIYFQSFSFNSYLDFEWGYNEGKDVSILNFSTGEYILFSMFARLFSVIDKKYSNSLDGREFILLIDEGETGLHPEWQRRFLKLLINFIENIFIKCRFQLLITTHSPFIVSDLPRSNIILISKDEITGKCNIENQALDHSFGENIYKLFKEGFFMKGFFGEFSSNKIMTLFEELRKENPDINNLEVEKIINIIAEPFIKAKLKEAVEKLNKIDND
jgi:predicted ATPase